MLCLLSGHVVRSCVGRAGRVHLDRLCEQDHSTLLLSVRFRTYRYGISSFRYFFPVRPFLIVLRSHSARAYPRYMSLCTCGQAKLRSHSSQHSYRLVISVRFRQAMFAFSSDCLCDELIVLLLIMNAFISVSLFFVVIRLVVRDLYFSGDNHGHCSISASVSALCFQK